MSQDALKDWERLFPDKKAGYGIVNIDVGVFFPYKNQEVVICEIGLLADPCFDIANAEDDDIFLSRDTVYNHRFSNQAYITLSRKIGRKISRTGYPICAPVSKLNSYKVLMIKLGTRDDTVTTCFPIDVKLTKDKPIGGLSIKIHHWEFNVQEQFENNMGYDFSTFETVFDKRDGLMVGKQQRYILGTPKSGWLEKDIPLCPMPTERENVLDFKPAMVIKGQPVETFFL